MYACLHYDEDGETLFNRKEREREKALDRVLSGHVLALARTLTLKAWHTYVCDDQGFRGTRYGFHARHIVRRG